MLSCCLVLGPVLQGLFSNALRNYFLFCYKQGQSPSAAQPGPAGAAGHPREKNSLYRLSTAKKPETRPHIVDRCPAHCHASCWMSQLGSSRECEFHRLQVRVWCLSEPLFSDATSNKQMTLLPDISLQYFVCYFTMHGWWKYRSQYHPLVAPVLLILRAKPCGWQTEWPNFLGYK